MPPFAVAQRGRQRVAHGEHDVRHLVIRTRLLIPASASCAELKAAATPMALRFWQGTFHEATDGVTNRGPASYSARWNWRRAPARACRRASAPARRLPWRPHFRPQPWQPPSAPATQALVVRSRPMAAAQ